LVNLAGSASSIKNTLGEVGNRFSPLGAPRPRGVSAAPASSAANGAEVFASPSLQVGFAAISLPAAGFGSGEAAADIVLSHQLSTGALWENIRMKGGAYGAFAHPDSLEGVFSFSSYRDPSPLRSLETFSSVLKELSAGGSVENDEALDKAVIGCYARETRPRTSAEKSLADFFRFLCGIEDRHRAERLKSLLEISTGEIAGVLKRLTSSSCTCPVIIAGCQEAEKAAAALGTEVKELPV
jgi:Zn-dependent M16 (insulinase) family peptidase